MQEVWEVSDMIKTNFRLFFRLSNGADVELVRFDKENFEDIKKTKVDTIPYCYYVEELSDGLVIHIYPTKINEGYVYLEVDDELV